MDFLMALHKAIDCFFCDRCPTEVYPEGVSKVMDVYSELCPFSHLWNLLPKEKANSDRKKKWPRSALERITERFK